MTEWRSFDRAFLEQSEVHVRLDSSSAEFRWSVAEATADLAVVGCALQRDGKCVKTFADEVEALQWIDRERRGDVDHTWVGFVGYEIGRRFEPRAGVGVQRKPATPSLAFGRVPDVSPKDASPTTAVATPDAAWASTFTRDHYIDAVRRCIEYIGAGDVFQVNLSQTLLIDDPPSPEVLYERLLRDTPARFGGMVRLGDVAVVSNSPELFLHVDPCGRVMTRPIKGTLPAGDVAGDLLESEKDAAELNMIVDLERNDLGRVCETGSVVVSEARTIETHPTVHHGIATVEGQLRADVGLAELLAATFPSGSVTGAPKIRAMQIIDELEPTTRGPYCGALGRLDADGSVLLNVAIRTATYANGRLHVPVGGGIVADSDPAAEFEETLVKARAFLRAAGKENLPVGA